LFNLLEIILLMPTNLVKNRVKYSTPVRLGMKDLVPKARNIRRGNVETAKFAKSEIKSRDQLTIPKKSEL